MGTYLQDHPPARRQFRARRRKPTGCIVIHTAESAPDEKGPDTGTDAVARFIRDRSTPGSYHTLVDSDSRLRLIPFDQAAYGDGTGSNEFAIHLSVATQAARWPTLTPAWRDRAVRQLAVAAAETAMWLKREHGIVVPAKRISKAQSDQGRPGFIAHGDRDPGRRTDPGAAFPWDTFLIAYAAELRRLNQPEPRPSKPAPKPAAQAAPRWSKIVDIAKDIEGDLPPNADARRDDAETIIKLASKWANR